MKVVVTGATGNVGTAVVTALGESSEIDEIVGIARRRPKWSPAKTTWVEADVTSSPLAGHFRGADAVVHLAWAIQPSHDLEAMELVNVTGSKRVFDAVVEAGVPKLVHASSVGAYSAGPKDRPVDESWPTEGTPSSYYARHKAACERLLDRLEEENPRLRVVRLRPGLIFRDEVATEIRHLFIGALLPRPLLRLRPPALPRIPGIKAQAVHSADVADAYVRAVVADVDGAFNIAAEPPLSSEILAARLGPGRTFPFPRSLARSLAALTWRLRLQPTSPGWLDMAEAVPLMSTERAREALGWSPRHTSIEAVEELLEGLKEGSEFPTPPLGDESLGEQLDEYLAEVHSIEEQALTQMRAAPRIAGNRRLAEAFERHLAETEEQERRVRERIESRGGRPSRVKDAAGVAGGAGMVAFAASQPDPPGKLVAHAYSYEHMEIAAYELLRRVAEQDEDHETATMAKEIAAEETAMAERLADRFDAAVDASLGADSGDELQAHLDRYLRDAHAIEEQAVELLKRGLDRVADATLSAAFAAHLEETRVHLDRLDRALESRGSESSGAKDSALSVGGLNVSAFFDAQPDTTTKLAGFAFAFEHLEIAAYELLKRVAERAGEESVVELAEKTLAEEREAARALAGTWDRPTVALGID